MIGNRIQQAHYASDFYRNYYHKVLNGLIVLSIIILLLIGYIVFLMLNQASPTYYATTLGGRIIPMEARQS